MKAVFVHDGRYTERDGKIYAEQEFSYASWQPYLAHFEELKIIGRTFASPDMPEHSRCDGKGVSFALQPALTNPGNFLFKRGIVARAITREIEQADAVILRGVQENAALAFMAARKLGKPLALEGTGCMWNNTWHYGTAAGKLYAPFRYRNARRTFKGADAVIYVTQDFLQRRYPTNGFTASASDVKLPPPDEKILQARLERIRKYEPGHVWKIGIIAPVHHAQKGIDTAIIALARLRKKSGPDFRLHILGRGEPSRLQALARRCGLSEHVIFEGTLPHDKVADWLDTLDLYLQPSRTEALPRAALEAMSRALPVIASDAGDLPYLIDPHFIHRRSDTKSLAEKIALLTADPRRMAGQARQNFDTVKTRFHPEVLAAQRTAFWKHFYDIVLAHKDAAQPRPRAGKV